jgi:hypothetical protein
VCHYHKRSFGGVHFRSYVPLWATVCCKLRDGYHSSSTKHTNKECILAICVPVAAPSCATCLASHSNGDILEQKIIIHLTSRNTQPCATVITKCYLHTYHSYCIITLHFCTFPIMITSSYLLSKYTQNLTKTRAFRTATAYHQHLAQPRLCSTDCVVQTVATWLHLRTSVPLSAICGLLNTATEPDRLQTSLHPRNN